MIIYYLEFILRISIPVAFPCAYWSIGELANYIKQLMEIIYHIYKSHYFLLLILNFIYLINTHSFCFISFIYPIFARLLMENYLVDNKNQYSNNLIFAIHNCLLQYFFPQMFNSFGLNVHNSIKNIKKKYKK